MNPQIKAKWVAALRSGNYEQTTGQLADFDEDNGRLLSFCCLGVLCRVVDPENHNDITWDNGMPPNAIMNEAGLSTDVAEVLTVANDGAREWPDTDTKVPKGNLKLRRKAKFTTIANYIERFL